MRGLRIRYYSFDVCKKICGLNDYCESVKKMYVTSLKHIVNTKFCIAKRQ